MNITAFQRLTVIGWIGYFLLTAVSTAGADNRIIDAEEQFRFAENYFQSGDYDRAITEFDRFVHFFPQDERVEQARFRKALAYHRNQEFSEAVEAFRGLIRESSNSDIFVRSHFLLSSGHMKQNHPDEARKTLESLLEKTDDPDLRHAVLYRMAWIDTETGDFVGAARTLEPIGPDGPPWLPIEELKMDLADAASLPRKDPTLAGILSLIPGGGYAYCHRYQDAITSFLVNGLLILAAVESFSDGNPALGGAIAFVGSGFYLGNIYGGVNAAHKTNDRLRQDAVNRMRDRYHIRTSPSSDWAGWQIHVQMDF